MTASFVQKLEARISKFETNSKFEIRKTRLSKGLFRVFFFELRICFGFRVSDFEFLSRARQRGSPPPSSPACSANVQTWQVRYSMSLSINDLRRNRSLQNAAFLLQTRLPC